MQLGQHGGDSGLASPATPLGGGSMPGLLTLEGCSGWIASKQGLEMPGSSEPETLNPRSFWAHTWEG